MRLGRPRLHAGYRFADSARREIAVSLECALRQSLSFAVMAKLGSAEHDAGANKVHRTRTYQLRIRQILDVTAQSSTFT